MLQPANFFERPFSENLVVLVVERQDATAEFEEHAVHELELLNTLLKSLVGLDHRFILSMPLRITATSRTRPKNLTATSTSIVPCSTSSMSKPNCRRTCLRDTTLYSRGRKSAPKSCPGRRTRMRSISLGLSFSVTKLPSIIISATSPVAVASRTN